MNDRELLKQAYDALGLINHRGNTDEELQKVGLTRVMIEARLEEPEPVDVSGEDWGNSFFDEMRRRGKESEVTTPCKLEEVYELRAENLTLKKALKLYADQFGGLPFEDSETWAVAKDLIKDV